MINIEVELIAGLRASGKTQKAIELSAKTGAVIITYSQSAAEAIVSQAKFCGFDIPRPISVRTLQTVKVEYWNGKRFIVDDIDTCFGALFDFECDAIVGCTITTGNRFRE